MGWSLGYDSTWYRDIGYGVPAFCDHPGCKKKIDRGLSYVCGGEPEGGNHGCGLHFCESHLFISHGKPQQCERCSEATHDDVVTFQPKPDHPQWMRHKLRHASWQQWRDENPDKVAELRAALA